MAQFFLIKSTFKPFQARYLCSIGVPQENHGIRLCLTSSINMVDFILSSSLPLLL